MKTRFLAFALIITGCGGPGFSASDSNPGSTATITGDGSSSNSTPDSNTPTHDAPLNPEAGQDGGQPESNPPETGTDAGADRPTSDAMMEASEPGPDAATPEASAPEATTPEAASPVCNYREKRCNNDVPEFCVPSGQWEQNGGKCNMGCNTDPTHQGECYCPRVPITRYQTGAIGTINYGKLDTVTGLLWWTSIVLDTVTESAYLGTNDPATLCDKQTIGDGYSRWSHILRAPTPAELRTLLLQDAPATFCANPDVDVAALSFSRSLPLDKPYLTNEKHDNNTYTSFNFNDGVQGLDATGYVLCIVVQ